MPTKIYLDIETIPDITRFNQPERADFVAMPKEVKRPGNIKKQETIDDWETNKRPQLEAKAQAEAFEEAQKEYEKALEDYKKKGLGSLENRIICISVLCGDKYHSFYGDNEKRVMTEFVEWYGQVKDPLWVVFNGKNFDIPVIAAKCVKYFGSTCGIPRKEKPWESGKVFDIFNEFPCNEKWPSMSKVAEFCGLKGKGDVDGSMVFDIYLDGDWETITTYCEDDCRMTMEIAKVLGV